MHRAQEYLDSSVLVGLQKPSVTSLVLTGQQAANLKRRLADDAVGYFFSGAHSIGEAVQGASQKRFTWATVKLYYASFYLCRALLALRGICLFYVGSTPYLLTSLAGESPAKGKETTHKVVLQAFRRSAIAPRLTSQQIDLEDPATWLIERREEANYGRARFIEPQTPRHFVEIEKVGLRRAVDAYITDLTMLYVFDPDHAILAYPVELMREVCQTFSAAHPAIGVSGEDLRDLASLFADSKGKFASASRLLSTP